MDIIKKTKNQTIRQKSSPIQPSEKRKFFDPSVATDRFKKLKIDSKFNPPAGGQNFKKIFKTKKRKLIFSLLLILIIILPLSFYFWKKQAGASWWNSDWFYRKSITVTNNTTAENNVYITLTLDTSDINKFQDDCGDIRFIRQNGEVLPYYIVSGCSTSSTVIHTNFPVFDAGSQIIDFYYGNPTAENGFSNSDFTTAASNYTIGTISQEQKGPSPALYLPFDEGFGSTAYDETSNRNDGTIVGATWKDESMCKNGKCLEFDGTGDYVEIADDPSLDLSEELTLEAWVKPTSTTPQNQTIISKEEKPTDPTKIYRSVGPSATSAITVGTTNAMTITGDSAIFQTALPDNVGVGDVIQYDDDDDGDIDTSDSLAFITGRISNTQYTISNVSGGTAVPVNSDTNWSLFRAYTSLANAESGIENTGIDSDLRNFDDWTAGGDATTDDVGKDLVVANQQWNIACYANGTTADTNVANINGWTTGFYSFINIYTPVNSDEVGVSQRHSGKWDDNKYRLETNSNSNGIGIGGAYYATIDGLQVKNSYNNRYAIASAYTSGVMTVRNCIIQGNNQASSGIWGIMMDSSVGGKRYIYNNIVYNLGTVNTTCYYAAGGGSHYYFNNTCYGANVGYHVNTATQYAELKNNIARQNVIGFENPSFIDIFYNNLSDDSVISNGAYGATYATGTTDGTTASKLMHSTATFITNGVQIGSIIKNTTDNTYTYVTALDSENQLSVANDIFVLGKGYSIYKNKYGTASFISTTAGSEDFHLSPTDTVAKNSGADLSGDSVFPFNSDIDGNRRDPSSKVGMTDTSVADKWDIGADEAQATQIYRSVAPGKTDALETGTDNSLTIDGYTATFQRALADNVGVGDVIQYDDDNDGDIDANDSLAFITSRISNFEYTVSSAQGGLSVAVSSDQDWSLFRAYTSLANAESGTENTGIDSDLRDFDTFTTGKDLVTSKEQWNIACYANETTADTTAVDVDGWSTGVQNFVKVYTPVNENEVEISQRHEGKWSDNYYKLEIDGTAINLHDSYAVIEGLQIYTSTASNYAYAIGIGTGGGNAKIEGNIIRGANNSGIVWNRGINVYDYLSAYTVNASNNIIYNFIGSLSVGIKVSETIDAYLYNNSIFNCDLGISKNTVGGIVVVKNNISQNCTTGFDGALDASSTNNITETSAENGAFGASADSGTTNGTTASKLVDSTQNFLTTVKVGMIIKNTTDTTYTYVTAIDSDIQLSVANDIFVSGEAYTIYTNKYGTATFLDESNNDFHLAKNDTVARNAGVNLYNDPYLPFETDIDGDSRLRQDSGVAQWDIGADEAVATKIYRSVGPGNTSALATDEAHENTVSVTGGTATFEVDLPDRIGVGDAVIIDTGGTANAIDASDTLLFISGRNSSTSYNLQTHTGAVPTNITSNDTYQIYRAYTSLANAEAGTKNTSIPITFNGGNRDIVTNNEEWNIACYGDGVDTAEVTVNGWATGMENFIKIYTPVNSNEVGVSQRHGGKWDNRKYQLVVNGNPISLRDLCVIMDGIQVRGNFSGITYPNALWYQPDDGSGDYRLYLSNSIFELGTMSGETQARGVFLNSSSAKMYVWNNIFTGWKPVSGVSGAYALYVINGEAYEYNNVIYDNYYGIRSTSNSLVENNAIFNNFDDFYSVSVSTIFNCASDDGDGTNPVVPTDWSTVFIDPANKDFRLKPTDTSLRGKGLNVSNDINLPVTHDIEGEIRPSLRQGYGVAMPSLATSYLLPTTSYSHDIGADQISSTIHNNYSLNLKTDYPQTNFSTSDSDRENFSSGDINLKANEWSHLVYKRDNNNEELFINGSKKDSGTISNFLKTNNGKIYLGAKNSSSENSFKGFMDEVRIYPYARTESEVKKDTTQGSSGRAASRAAEGVSVSMGDQANNLSDGLVGYWKMDETSWTGATNEVRDASGNNNHATAVGGSTVGAGKFGNGGGFDGTNGYVSISSTPASLNLSTFTLAFWAKRNSLDSIRTLISTGLLNNNKGFQVQCLFSTLSLQRDIAGSNEQINRTGSATSDPCTDTNWHYYTIVVDGTSVSAYSDGNSIALTGSWTAPINSYAGTPFNISTRQDFNQKWDGQIDEAKVYNRALSADEVKQLYNYAPGPVLHLKMDEKVQGDAKTLNDSSGNNNNGTTVDGANNTGMDCSAQGKINGACEFDGVDDSVEFSDMNSLENKNVSFSFWFKLKDSSQDYDLITKGDHNTYQPLVIWFDDIVGAPADVGAGNANSLSVLTYDGSVQHWVATPSNSIPIGEWVYANIIIDNGNDKILIYINGKLVASNTKSWNGIGDTAQILRFGANEGSIQRLNGYLDDVKIYNYAQTQEQIFENIGASTEAPVSRGGALKSPILDLNFNEGYGSTANDSSGNGNNGILIPGAGGTNTTATMMWDKGGKEGGAMEFDNLNDYVNAGSNINIANKSFTISSWAKRNGNADADYIAGQGSASNNVGLHYGFRVGNTFTCAFVGNDLDATIVSDTNWHHWVCSYDADSNLRIIYQDGKEIARGVATADYQGTGVFNVGARYSTADSFFNGLIDEFKIYNYALGEDEINTLYNSSSAMAMGNDESRNNNGTEVSGANKDYCVPGDTAKCDKPILELKMNEKSGTTANDASGTGKNGALTNGPVWDRGKINGGLRFDGSDDYVLIGSDSAFDITGTITVSAWIKFDRINNSSSAILEKTQYYRFGLQDVGTSSRLWWSWIDSGSTFHTLTGNTYLQAGRFYHVVGVYDGQYSRVYVDGKQDNSNNFGYFAMKSGSANLYLNYRDTFNGISGVIDEVRLFNYARTPAQIAWDYNQGSPINHWTFDEGTGTIAHDLGEAKNHSTNITGAVWKNESECKTGKCLYLNGLDNTLVRADTLDNMKSFTACTWVKPSSFTNAGNDTDITIFNKGWGLTMYNDGKMRFRIPSSSTYPTFDTSESLILNQWQRVCGVYYGFSSTPKIYVNGKEFAGSGYPGSGAQGDDSATGFGIGGYISNVFTGNFNGYIDDPKIYNYALTAEQIKQDYNGGAVNFK